MSGITDWYFLLSSADICLLTSRSLVPKDAEPHLASTQIHCQKEGNETMCHLSNSGKK